MTNRGFEARAATRAGHGCRGPVGFREGARRMGAGGAVAVGIVVVGLGALAGRPARACSPGIPTPIAPTALPRAGATDVPTATSLVVLAGALPVDLTLTVGGVAVALEPPVPLGFGEGDAMGRAFNFWQVKGSGGFLPAAADLVLSASDGNGGRVTLTSIHTAAGYDKQPGTPATLKSLTLTRVRYPIAEIASGDCLFSEYLGFISFEADPATIPGTPPDSVVNTITLRPRYGGAADQSRTYTGAASYSGDPPGGFGPPPPSVAEWMPYLDPTLEYCAGITSFGYGDVARLPLTSNALCVRVQQVSMPGARVDSDAGAVEELDGAAGGGAATDAQGAGGAGGGPAMATPPDGGGGTVGHDPIAVHAGGCDVASGPAGRLSEAVSAMALAFALGAAASGARRRERAVSSEGRARRR
jgi:hypothetical protein